MHNTFFTLSVFIWWVMRGSVHKYLCTVSPVTRDKGRDNPNFGKNRNLNALDAIIVFQLCSQKGPWSMFQFFGSTSGSVRSTSLMSSLLSLIHFSCSLVKHDSGFCAAYSNRVILQIEPTNQELSPNIVEVVQSSPVERPSTSTAVFGTGRLILKWR